MESELQASPWICFACVWHSTVLKANTHADTGRYATAHLHVVPQHWRDLDFKCHGDATQHWALFKALHWGATSSLPPTGTAFFPCLAFESLCKAFSADLFSPRLRHGVPVFPHGVFEVVWSLFFPVQFKPSQRVGICIPSPGPSTKLLWRRGCWTSYFSGPLYFEGPFLLTKLLVKSAVIGLIL